MSPAQRRRDTGTLVVHAEGGQSCRPQPVNHAAPCNRQTCHHGDHQRKKRFVKILLAEDDARLVALLERALTEAGWSTDVVRDGHLAYDRSLSDPSYDLAILDWMLPGMDGATISHRLRNLGLGVPTLLLTPQADNRHRIDGPGADSDDYLPQPSNLDDLLSRLEALHRRSEPTRSASLRIADITVEPRL